MVLDMMMIESNVIWYNQEPQYGSNDRFRGLTMQKPSKSRSSKTGILEEEGAI